MDYRGIEDQRSQIFVARCQPLSCEAWRELSASQGRSPDLQVIARLATFPSLRDSGFPYQRATCSQWRDRAGFSPASLFTRRFKTSTLRPVMGITKEHPGSSAPPGPSNSDFRIL